MSVRYTLSKKRNALRPDEKEKWYATAKSTGEVTLKALGKEITQRSTVNHADTLAVLESLTQLLVERLAEGKIVRFGDFGAFQITLGSSGADKEDHFSAALIKSKKVTFRPGADLRDMLKTLKFEKI